MNRVQDTPDDVVIQICRHLSVRDIIAFRQTCKHVFAVSRLKTLWISLCTTYVTAQGIPFPNEDRVKQMSAPELEIATCEAIDRDHRLRSGSRRDGYTPKEQVDWQANQSSAISEIHFVADPAGHEGRCIVSVSKGIWCLISLWDIQTLGRECEATKPKPKTIGSWGPKGAIFGAISVNSDPRSEASAAVTVTQYGEHLVYVLSFFDTVTDRYPPRVHVLRSWNPTLSLCSSVSLRGDILVVADSRDRATAVNVHSPEARALILESTTVSEHPQMSNTCLQIQISQSYVLVARAKFVEVFNSPMDILTTDPTRGSSDASLAGENVQERIVQHPIDSFSFGWLDGISVSEDFSKPDSFFVLFRQPNEDPWSTDPPTLAFYRLEANSAADGEEDLPLPSNANGSTSQLFSGTFLAPALLSAPTGPTPTSSSASTKFVLGRHRTALWLSPRPRESDSTGLVQMDLNRPEDWPSQASGTRIWRRFMGDDLVWATFDLKQTQSEIQDDDENLTRVGNEEDSKLRVHTRRIYNSRAEVWTAIGYDEETGRVALGRRDGHITFLRL